MGKRKKSKIVFDSEIVTKEAAEKIVAQHDIREQINNEEENLNFENKNTIENGLLKDDKKPRKKKKRKDTQPNTEENATEVKEQKTDEDSTIQDNEEPNKPTENVKCEESIRAKKRKKHAALMQEKKLKSELALQQKCLNYLSQWKHNRSDWKFEKLKQVWLQQNMFNADKVPEEIWDTLVEYFAGCKGKARETIIQDALKVIEGDEDEESGGGVDLKRARDIIQNMQE